MIKIKEFNGYKLVHDTKNDNNKIYKKRQLIIEFVDNYLNAIFYLKNFENFKSGNKLIVFDKNKKHYLNLVNL